MTPRLIETRDFVGGNTRFLILPGKWKTPHISS